MANKRAPIADFRLVAHQLFSCSRLRRNRSSTSPSFPPPAPAGAALVIAGCAANWLAAGPAAASETGGRAASPGAESGDSSFFVAADSDSERPAPVRSPRPED